MLTENTEIIPHAKTSKKAQKFVQYLTKKQISLEDLPIYNNDNGHALVIMNDRMDSTGYPYSWELIFNPEQDLVLIKAIKVVEIIQPDLAYHVLEVVNEKNKSTLWGKFFLHNNAVYMMSPLNNYNNKLKSSHILKTVKAMRISIEELHKELIKVLL